MSPQPVNGGPPPSLDLDEWKRTADPSADGLINGLFARGQARLLNALLESLDHPESAPAPAHEALAAFLRSATLPVWAEPERILRAQRLFLRHGPAFGVVLMLSSLPVLYAGAFGGSQILAMTGQLTKNFRRRASETLRFILDAMEPGGLNPEGKGVKATRKVRLMHATVRQFAQGAGWSAHPDWGQPINQEELAGTLLAFSSVALDGLRKLGIAVDGGEQEDYLHAWKCIGFVLGVREECLPADMASARMLWQRIGRRNFRRTPEGLALMQAHLEFVKELLPGHAEGLLIESLLRFLMGKQVACAILGLPKASWADFFLNWIRFLLRLDGLWIFKGRVMNRVLEGLSRELMESLYKFWHEGGPPPFRMPTSLAAEPGQGGPVG